MGEIRASNASGTLPFLLTLLTLIVAMAFFRVRLRFNCPKRIDVHPCQTMGVHWGGEATPLQTLAARDGGVGNEAKHWA